MKNYFKEAYDYVNSFHPLTEAVYKELYDSATITTLKTGEKLLNEGDVPEKIFFIAEGVMRAYQVLDSGKELTSDLHHPFSFFGSLKALLQKKPSKIIYQALTDCFVYELDFEKFKNLCNDDLEMNILYCNLLEYLLLRSERRFAELSHKDATQRYLALREEIDNLDNRIPQYQIASALGITPVQLSRIRAKL